MLDESNVPLTPTGTSSDQADVREPISSGCIATPFNADGAACQGGALGTPFFLFTNGTSPLSLFADAYRPDTPVTGGASSIGTSSAIVSGAVNPAGAAVNVFFEYGTTTALRPSHGRTEDRAQRFRDAVRGRAERPPGRHDDPLSSRGCLGLREIRGVGSDGHDRLDSTVPTARSATAGEWKSSARPGDRERDDGQGTRRVHGAQRSDVQAPVEAHRDRDLPAPQADLRHCSIQAPTEDRGGWVCEHHPRCRRKPYRKGRAQPDRKEAARETPQAEGQAAGHADPQQWPVDRDRLANRDLQEARQPAPVVNGRPRSRGRELSPRASATLSASAAESPGAGPTWLVSLRAVRPSARSVRPGIRVAHRAA
jgi:hypothetical protein